MMWRVLISAPYFQRVLNEYLPLLTHHGIEPLVPPVRERLSEAELLPLVTDIDGALCGDDEFTDAVLHAARRLRVIAKWGTGVDSIRRDTAARLGIRVFSTPNVFTDPVADSVMGYVLCFARGLLRMTQDMRQGKWEKIRAYSLHERVLGVIGLGNIGKAVIRRAVAFRMRVLGSDIKPVDPNFVEETGIVILNTDHLLHQADFVSINCDLNATSLRLIGERELELMKPTAYLINTARGRIVHERALIQALRERRIAGAALDVFEEEPLHRHNPLRQLDSVLLSPHNGNSSPTAWKHVHENSVRCLLRGLRESTECR